MAVDIPLEVCPGSAPRICYEPDGAALTWGISLKLPLRALLEALAELQRICGPPPPSDPAAAALLAAATAASAAAAAAKLPGTGRQWQVPAPPPPPGPTPPDLGGDQGLVGQEAAPTGAPGESMVPAPFGAASGQQHTSSASSAPPPHRQHAASKSKRATPPQPVPAAAPPSAEGRPSLDAALAAAPPPAPPSASGPHFPVQGQVLRPPEESAVPLASLSGSCAGSNHGGSTKGDAEDAPALAVASGWSPLTRLDGQERWIRHVAWSPDGRRIATATDEPIVRVWECGDSEPKQWQLLTTLEGHSKDIWAAAWSPDSRRLASASTDASVIVWAEVQVVPGGEQRWDPVAELRRHKGTVCHVAWSPDGCHLATGAMDHIAHVWQFRSQTAPREATRVRARWDPVAALDRHSGTVRVTAWCRDGSLLLTGSDDGTAIIWRAPKRIGEPRPLWCPLAVLDQVPPMSWAMAWSPAGDMVVTARHSSQLCVWKAQPDAPSDWRIVAVMKGHTRTVRTCSWSPDGSRILSGGDDLRTLLWRRVGEDSSAWEVEELPPARENQKPLTAAAWSPDGSMVALGRLQPSVEILQSARPEPAS